MKKRSVSWSSLLNLHGQEFLNWLDENGLRFQLFDKLSEDLEHYIKMSLVHGSYESVLSTNDLCKQFANCIPSIYTNLNNPQTYEHDMAALAYAHVHLLERYKRSWDILIHLLKAAVLPMSDKGLEILDVGTGPAPVLYAVSDFYEVLQKFADNKGYPLLVTPLPNFHSIESSQSMQHFMHTFSEISNRTRGPYFTSFNQFEGLNFNKLRENKRWAIRQGEEYYDHETASWETWYEDVDHLGPTEGMFRYNFVVFSNFLTEKDKVEDWKEELLSAFLTVRHGGIVVVTGSSKKTYEQIYDTVEKVAKKAGIGKVTEVSDYISCQYSDPYALRIKKHYNIIWKWIRENSDMDDHFLISKKIDKKLWEPQKILNGSKDFKLLVFRRNGQPWKRRQ